MRAAQLASSRGEAAKAANILRELADSTEGEERARALAKKHGAEACASFDELVAKSDTGARARRMAPPARANGQIAGVAAFLKDYVDRGDLGVKTGRGFYATRSPPTHGPASSSRRTHDVHITGAFEH